MARIDEIKARVGFHPIKAGSDVAYLIARVERLEAALRPFAEMHRDGSDPDEMACQRGIASDATYLFSSHFADAAKALESAE